MLRLPDTFRQEIPTQDTFRQIDFLKQKRINTVCLSAHCPNLTRCFKSGHATFMILGDTCTRNCNFCAVDKSKNESLDLDYDEPQRIAEVAKDMSLRYIVVTSVTRDDLDDAGAGHFARTVRCLKDNLPGAKIEILIPDFKAKSIALRQVVDSGPEVIAHNLETVERLYPLIRPKVDYFTSLNVLKMIKRFNPHIITKSSLILGMGEDTDEVINVLKDLREANCDILTLGQYLSPSVCHYPVKEFINQEKFDYYRNVALTLGFRAVAAGPLVRSSYRAEEMYREAILRCQFTMS